jgi:hypothetical protein
MEVPALRVIGNARMCAARATPASFAVAVNADSLDQISVQAQRDHEKLEGSMTDGAVLCR